MTGIGGQARAGTVAAPRGLARWECRCQEPPILLGTYDLQGRINIKMRDRYWHIDGVVQTVCPRCGSEHTLDLRSESASRQDGESARDESASRQS